MKKRLLLIIAACISFTTFGQVSASLNNIEIPQEKIFVHFNTTFLLTGEYFYYKVYCLNNKTEKLSNFSKIAYIELFGNNNQVVFKHKINLIDGLGQGDFFIPTSVASGNYKIVAYTQWMQNTNMDHFFQNDVVIINPFQSDQKAVLRIEEKDDDKHLSSSLVETKKGTKLNNTSLIELILNEPNFSTRKKVNLTIKNISDIIYGNYSISIRKTEELQTPQHESSTNFMSKEVQFETNTSTLKSTNTFIPELRGELLKGRVFEKETNKPVANFKVALSIPGKNYIFKISNTNKLGEFYFNLDQVYDSPNAIIQLIGDEDDKFDFVLIPPTPIGYRNLTFNNFTITPKIKDLILQHSIDNQIENAYSKVKTDSIIGIPTFLPFYSKASHEYLLDDYTRFPTIKETILEVIEQASVRQKNNKYRIHVRVYDEGVESGLRSLLLIDGLFIQDHHDVVVSKANKIKKISVVNEQYIYGSEIFEGIIIMETFEGDYKNKITGNFSKNIKLFKPLAKKKYFKQVYDGSDKLNRIPDYRSQLLWEPNLELKSKEIDYTFYTSDLTGEFEIRFEGFNKIGKPVSVTKTFNVN